MTETVDIPLVEAVSLAARDSIFYSRFFFPRTVRQASPGFHRDIWQKIETPGQRYTGAMVYRDGAKTSLARLFTSKRIAYGISHTILFTSKTEAHAIRSVNWVAKQVMFNPLWADTFGLKRGLKWSEGEIEILHGVEEFPIRLIAVGMTGQLRGINIDDYRPDLIVADDVDDEESAGTEAQREKSHNLFFGSLMNTLAAPTEATDPRAIILATPQHPQDIISTCARDPKWSIAVYGCFDERGESRWPEKWPTSFLDGEKQSYINRNQLSLWMREKECKLVSAEIVSFRQEWLKFIEVLPANAFWLIAIDPASSDNKKTADDFSISLMCFYAQKVYLVDQYNEIGTMPDKACAVIFQWLRQFPVRNLVAETVGYQKILKWYIEKEMMAQRLYRTVLPFDDKRSKADRILQSILKVAPFGNLIINPRLTKFREQYGTWFPGADMHDDALDSVSIGISTFFGKLAIEGEFEIVADPLDDPSVKALTFADDCP